VCVRVYVSVCVWVRVYVSVCECGWVRVYVSVSRESRDLDFFIANYCLMFVFYIACLL